ncbi:MAG TPA: cellulase family glycosylhydrolase, partial [Chryseolinea sp.]
MRISTRYLVLTGFVLISLNTIAQTPPLSRISVSGNKFVTADGKTIVFRGLDTSDPDKLSRENHWNKEYFEAMKDWGANVVRFPVHPSAWRSQGKDNYIKLLDQGVEWAASLGMYVIIDWHSIGNLRSEMFQHIMYETTRKETYEFWRTMAGHFKDNTTVAFFELFNEPTVYNGQLGTCTWSEWKAMNEEMIIIIRANGAKAIPLVAGFNWAYDLT